MKPTKLDHNFRLPLFATILFVANLIFFCNAFAEYKVELNHMNEVTHLEIPGISQADYQIDKRKNGVIEIQVSALDPKSTDFLNRYSDQFIQKISVQRNSSLSRDVVTIVLNNKENLEMFDYLTDSPSSLSIDFYIDDNPQKTASTASEESEKLPPAKKKDPVNAQRSIASSEFIKQIEDISLMSELEEIQKEQVDKSAQSKKNKPNVRISTFEKEAKPVFEIDKVDFTLNTIIENRGKLFIKFPILFNEDEYLAQLLTQKIEYEAKVESDSESKDFWKTKRLFGKGDFRQFLRARKIFSKKYPKSRFAEMSSYMEAEAIFSLYKLEGNEILFDEALKLYDGLLTKYPESNLAERTLLMVSYLRMKKGRYMDGVRSLKLYSQRYKRSPLVPNIELIMAQGLLRLQEYEESLKIYQKLLQSESPDVKRKAYFDVGDVFFEKKDYEKAIKYYTQALDAYPGGVKKYPNVSFNLGEAQFLSEKYKESLASYKKFIDMFPQHEYAAYAWTRLGEILETAEVDPKLWKGYYNESFFRFQSSNGGIVAKLNLLTHKAIEQSGIKFDMVIDEMRSFYGKMNIPHASDFITVKIADTYFNKGFYKKATDELIGYFQKETIPTYEDKFLKRIGRGISFQIREELNKNNPQAAFALFDKYDSLWLRKSKRSDFPYLKGLGFEQAHLYEKASQQYAQFLKDFVLVPDPDEQRLFEQLPKLDEIRLRYANTLMHQKKILESEQQLGKIAIDQLEPHSQQEWYYISAKLADEKNDTVNAIKYAEKVKVKSMEQAEWLSDLYKKNTDFDKSIRVVDKFLDENKLSSLERFKLLKRKLSVLEQDKNQSNKYYEFIKKFYAEFKDQKVDFDREKYQLGLYYTKQDKSKEAEEVWQGIQENSYWKKMAQESRNEKKWDDQYKKYINRIPAMVPGQELKQ